MNSINHVFFTVRSDQLLESEHAWLYPQMHGMTFWDKGYMQSMLAMHDSHDLIIGIYEKESKMLCSWMILIGILAPEIVPDNDPSDVLDPDDMINADIRVIDRIDFYNQMINNNCEVAVNTFTRKECRGHGYAKKLLNFVESMIEPSKILIFDHDAPSKILYESLIEKGAAKGH